MEIESTKQVGDAKEKDLIRLHDVEDFLKHCDEFMPILGNGLETMTQEVSDTLLDAPNLESDDSLRCQLKFLRELGFFFKNLIKPV